MFGLLSYDAKAIYLIYTYMQTTIMVQTANLLFKCNYRFCAAYFSFKMSLPYLSKYLSACIYSSLLSVHTQNIAVFFSSFFSCSICQWSTMCTLALFMLSVFLLFHFLNPINFVMCLLESSSSTFSVVWNCLISSFVFSECLLAYRFWIPFHRWFLVCLF